MISQEKRKNGQKRIWLIFISIGLLLTILTLLLMNSFPKQGDISKLSGDFICPGQSEGMYAITGTMHIEPDGSFFFGGFYAPNSSGTLYWLNETDLASREATDFALITVNDEAINEIHVYLKEGVVYGHIERDYMLCTRYEP